MVWKRSRHRKSKDSDLVLDLLYATISKDIKRVEELIECGIDPCTLMEDGTSPLHKAAVMENPYGALIISSMLRYGANPNVKTVTGLSPLHIAAMWGRVKTIDVLLDNGADVLVKDDDDRSALDYADEAEENRIECIDALTRYRGTTPCRAAPCFISKSRLNLDKIIGGDISLSTMSNEFSVNRYDITPNRSDMTPKRSDMTPNRSDIMPNKSSVLENTSIRVDNVLAEQQARYGSKIRKSLLRRFSSYLDTKSRGVNVGVQTETPKDKKNKEKKKKEKKKKKESEQPSKQNFIEEFVDKLDIDVPDGVPRKEALSNEEHINSFSRDDSNFLVSSTLLEDPTIYNTALSVPDLSSVKEEGRKNSSSSSSSSNSSNSNSSSSGCSNSSGSMELALRQSTPVTKELVGSSCKMETIAVVHAPGKTDDTEANNSTLSSNSSSKQQHRPKIGWELGKITSKSSSKQTISSKDLKITQHGSNSNLYIPVPISTAKANNCNLSIKISIADGQTKKQLYTKKLGSVQITSPPQSGKKQKQKQRKKNEKGSKTHQHCYEEIPPLQTPTTMLDRRPSSITSASDQPLLSTTTFESATEFQSDAVQYDEVGAVVRKTPTHSGDEKKSKKSVNTPPKRPPPPNFEKRHSVVQAKTEISLEPNITANQENVTNKDKRVSREPCVEPPIQPTSENLQESIPRQPVSPTLNRVPDTGPSHPSPPRDDSLEPSLCNTTKELSNNTNSLYNVTKELSGNANSLPIDAAAMSSEISEVSSSFVNLDASELTTYGDSTFEAKIELNQSTIDYIGPPVDQNGPTLDYINTATNAPPASDANKDGKIYTNTDANNIAPVSELVHYFEVRSVADESEVLDVSCPQLLKPDASCHMHEDGVSCNVEDYLNRQFQKLEDVIVTHQFDSGNVSDENCSSRSRSRSSPCNQGTKKTSDGGTQKLLDAMKKHTPQIEEGDDVLGYAVSNSSLEDDVFLTPQVINGELEKNGLLRNTGQCSGTRLFDLYEQSYSPRFPNDWNCYDQPAPTHSLKDSKNLVLSNDVKSSQNKSSLGIEESLEMKAIRTSNNPVLASNNDVLTPRRSISPNLNNINKSRDNELHDVCVVRKSEYELPISIDKAQTQPITVQHSPEKRLNKHVPQPAGNNVKSSELYEDSSVESENQTVIDTHNCIHNCDEEEEQKEEGQEDQRSWSSSSYGFDETDRLTPIKPPVVHVVRKPPRGILAEYGEVVVNYCWKDVCGFSSELEKSMVSIPNRITTLHDDDLRMRLQKIGVCAHEITDKTRKIYQRYLVKVEKSHSKGMEAMEDYTTEMAQVMSGDTDVRGKDGELLEEEMKLQFMNPEKFTWREGTQSNSFNVLLLDPRVTNNLPTRSRNMSYMEAFKVFVSAIFFVGRGRRCRPNEQLEEAARYKTKLVNNKIRMIHDIWSSGLGVISLSTFNNIIPVEAFTREACMIEALGKSRLTNTKSGDLYGLASTWNTKKRRLLGIYILTKAMDELLSQGEKQIRLDDIESVSELRNSSRLSMSPLGSVVKDEKLRNDVIRTSSYPSARMLRDSFFSVK